jgi:hypothetical protein
VPSKYQSEYVRRDRSSRIEILGASIRRCRLQWSSQRHDLPVRGAGYEPAAASNSMQESQMIHDIHEDTMNN